MILGGRRKKENVEYSEWEEKSWEHVLERCVDWQKYGGKKNVREILDEDEAVNEWSRGELERMRGESERE